MLSQTTEYALRIMVYLASLNGTPATIQQIGSATKIPTGYLAKVLRNLALAKLVLSQRGIHGGSVLARPAATITVLDVVQALSPIQQIKHCPLGIKSHGIKLCPLHDRLGHTITMVEQAYASSSIAKLVPKQTEAQPFCNLSARLQKKNPSVLQ